jgi:phenylpropionate dioxygenase-like ring-hydroxylating dioxygenase large terminal subunit
MVNGRIWLTGEPYTCLAMGRRGISPVPACQCWGMSLQRTVPDELLGCWVRTWIRWADGRFDDRSDVLWVQTASVMADLRLAHDRRDLTARRSLADCSFEDLLDLARSESSSGTTRCDPLALDPRDRRATVSWHTGTDGVDFQTTSAYPEPGLIEWNDDGTVMIERAPSGAYEEEWRLLPESRTSSIHVVLDDPDGRAARSALPTRTSGRAEIVSDLFRRLAEHAKIPYERAILLPPEAYTSPDVLDAERTRVFAHEWLCAGRVADVALAGDYITVDVPSGRPGADHHSVIVVRDERGELGAFANVCAHRCATLLQGTGSTARITCPYHAWVYRLDGRLVAAPYMQRTVDAAGRPFDPADHHLQRLKLEVWEGFVYVNADPDATPLGPRLTGLTEVVGRYRMDGYVPVANGVEEWDTNWKCLAENFMDAYHVFKVHRNTFAADSDSTGNTTVYPGTDAYAYHLAIDDPASSHGVAHPDNTTLDAAWRHTTALAAVFPAHVMQLQADWLWYLALSPVGTDRVRIRWDVSVAPEQLAAQPDPDAYVARVIELLTRVNAEDRPVVEGVHRGLRRADAPRGPFSYLERNVYDFDRYIARCIGQD